MALFDMKYDRPEKVFFHWRELERTGQKWRYVSRTFRLPRSIVLQCYQSRIWKTRPELVNHYCAGFFSLGGCASPSTVVSNFDGRNSFEESPFSMIHLLNTTEDLEMAACTR